MLVKQKDKEVVKRFIECVFKNENEDVYSRIQKIFGDRLAQKVDEEVFLAFYDATMKKQLHYIKYIDVLEKLSRNLDITFDVSFEDVKDCFFGSNRSIYTEDDKRYIYE